jgi:hypothetical protein
VTKERERKEAAKQKLQEHMERENVERGYKTISQLGMEKLVEEKLKAVKKWEKEVYNQTAIILSDPSLVSSLGPSTPDPVSLLSENESNDDIGAGHEELISLVDENSGGQGQDEEEEDEEEDEEEEDEDENEDEESGRKAGNGNDIDMDNNDENI